MNTNHASPTRPSRDGTHIGSGSRLRRASLVVFLLTSCVLLEGCLLIRLRPTGEGIGVTKKDLPRVSRLEGDKVYSMLQPDKIAAIDEPEMVAAAGADFMADDELVLGVVRNGEARAYSLWHLDRHEIVNDWAGGEPIAATW